MINGLPLGNDKADQFDPSPRILNRVLKLLKEESAIGRTRLAQAANVHYAVLLKHLQWMEQRRYIELVLEDGKVMVRLTQKGREFVALLSGLYR